MSAASATTPSAVAPALAARPAAGRNQAPPPRERDYSIGSGTCAGGKACCGPESGTSAAVCTGKAGRCYPIRECRDQGWPLIDDDGACRLTGPYDCCKSTEQDPCSAVECEDIVHRTGESNEDWRKRCGENACGLVCTNVGDWCVPPDKKTCVPGTLGVAGAEGDLHWDGSACWRCAIGGWQTTSATACGCEKYGNPFRVDASTWFDDQKCYTCQGMGKWQLSQGRCSETCLIWVGRLFDSTGLYKRVQPGNRLCNVESMLSGCRVENGKPSEFGIGPCLKGCIATTLNPDCSCARDECPACPLTDKVPEPGEVGDTYLSPPPQNSCFACTESEWSPSTLCWCPSTTGPGVPGKLDGDKVWVQGDGKCWSCVRSGILQWTEASADSCPESSCAFSTPATSVRVPYQQWVCEAAIGGLYNLKQCLGENRWGAVQGCGQGCDPGSVFSSAEQASC